MIGVVYGTNDVGLIAEFASVDDETGEKRPEVQRIVSFALAHYTENLAALAGPATGGRPLIEEANRTY